MACIDYLCEDLKLGPWVDSARAFWSMASISSIAVRAKSWRYLWEPTGQPIFSPSTLSFIPSSRRRFSSLNLLTLEWRIGALSLSLCVSHTCPFFSLLSLLGVEKRNGYTYSTKTEHRVFNWTTPHSLRDYLLGIMKDLSIKGRAVGTSMKVSSSKYQGLIFLTLSVQLTTVRSLKTISFNDHLSIRAPSTCKQQ